VAVNCNCKKLVFIFLIGLILIILSKAPDIVLSRLSLSEEYNKIYFLYDSMHENFKMKSSFEVTKDNLMLKINELNIDTDIMQDKIINTLCNISQKNNIELSNIKFSDVMPVSFDSDETLETQDVENNNAICMKVTVEFNGYFNDMLSFVEDIKNSETEISVLDISILLIDSYKVHAVINLMFYALPLNYGR
jgi:hypothetical protein